MKAKETMKVIGVIAAVAVSAAAAPASVAVTSAAFTLALGGLVVKHFSHGGERVQSTAWIMQ